MIISIDLMPMIGALLYFFSGYLLGFYEKKVISKDGKTCKKKINYLRLIFFILFIIGTYISIDTHKKENEIKQEKHLKYT